MKRGGPGTTDALPRQRRNVTSSFASCRELWGWEGVTDEPAPHQNAPASASPARFATR